MARMLDQARKTQAAKRAQEREPDPADLGDIEEPDWDSYRTAPEESSSSETVSASEKASGKEGAKASNKASGKAGGKVSRKESGNVISRRKGRPRGPERVPLSVRILPENDSRLTQAVEQSGKSPQYLVEEALELLFKRMKIR